MRFHVPRLDRTPYRDSLEFHPEALATSVGAALRSDGLEGYERDTMCAALALVESYGLRRFVDVGANIGIYSLLLKAVFGDGILVSAYEPTPALVNVMRKLAVINDLYIDAHEIALSDYCGTASFYISAKSDSSSSLNPSFRASRDVINVAVRTLDEEIGGFEGPLELIKIDTESTEPAVLRGAADVIRRDRPWIICEVLHGRGEAELQRFVDSLGYSAYHLNGTGMEVPKDILGDPTYIARDWLLAPEAPSPSSRMRYAEWRKAFLTNA